MIPFAILSSILKEKNDRIFGGSSSSIIDLISKITLRIKQNGLWLERSSLVLPLTILFLVEELVWGVAHLRRGEQYHGAPPPFRVLKFNVDGASMGKLGLARI